jgi:hypothetical protein
MRFRDDSNEEYKVYGFAAFKENFHDPEQSVFKEWLTCLAKLFRNLEKGREPNLDPRFKRIVAVHIILTEFINYMDPKHIRTKDLKGHWKYLTSSEQERLRKRIESARV